MSYLLVLAGLSMLSSGNVEKVSTAVVFPGRVQVRDFILLKDRTDIEIDFCTPLEVSDEEGHLFNGRVRPLRDAMRVRLSRLFDEPSHDFTKRGGFSDATHITISIMNGSGASPVIFQQTVERLIKAAVASGKRVVIYVIRQDDAKPIPADVLEKWARNCR